MKVGERRARLVAALLAIGAVAAFVPVLRADAAPTVSRLAGSDRYETAAAISAASFSPGVPVVYLATGLSFPDALAGAPAAAKGGGPVLLSTPGGLPAATATELDRLDPGKIVVLGGTTAIGQAVQDQLAQYTSGTVTRIQGADRYATAAALSASIFTPGVSTVYVGTGANFPDALAGGPVAANAPPGGAPVLLVTAGTVPPATATELTRLAAQKVVILGGTEAVPDTVKNQLENYSVDPVTRRSGADRYLTSVDISSFHFATATKVYLATGTDFPDALAAGSPAGIADSPVLLTRPTCIPPEVNSEITRLNPTSLIVLGGTTAVSDAVLSRTVCVPPTTTTTVGSTTTTQAPVQGVTPGAFCSPAGATGVSTMSVPMTCQTASCEGQAYETPRWRRTVC